MNAVGADQHIRPDARAVLEPGLGPVAAIGEPDKTVAQMDMLGRETRGDDRQQIGAVQGHVRRAVKFFAQRVERRALQGTAVLPAALMGSGRAHRLAVEPFGEPEPAQYARRVRAHVDAAPDFGQFGRLLVDLDRETSASQRQGGGQAADSGANHGDLARGARHPMPRVGRIHAPLPPDRRLVALRRLPASERLMRLR
jgi:hypothetical protein